MSEDSRLDLDGSYIPRDTDYALMLLAVTELLDIVASLAEQVTTLQRTLTPDAFSEFEHRLEELKRRVTS